VHEVAPEHRGDEQLEGEERREQAVARTQHRVAPRQQLDVM
jgi:hypothetical protein